MADCTEIWYVDGKFGMRYVDPTHTRAQIRPEVSLHERTCAPILYILGNTIPIIMETVWPIVLKFSHDTGGHGTKCSAKGRPGGVIAKSVARETKTPIG